MSQHLLIAARPALHRYALWLSRTQRAALPAEDAMALADLGAVRAWPRFDSSRGVPFRHFARRWVLGEVADALRQVRRAPLHHMASEAPSRDSSVDAKSVATNLLERLSMDEQRFLLSHVVEERSLSELAAAAGRHRAWGTRRFKKLSKQLREL